MNNDSQNHLPEVGDEWYFIYRSFITLRNGRRLYAASKGLRAFRLRVKRKKNDE
jgi:hypothetical protein